MKNIYKYLGLFLAAGTILFGSCETTDLNLSENPNQLRPDQSSADLFLNSIQVDFATFVEIMGQNGGQLIRVENMNGRSYRNVNAFSSAQLNQEWNIAYQADNGESLSTGLEINGLLADIRAMAPEALEQELFHHTAIGQFFEAYTMITLVDFFGDVPYSEAMQANAETPILNPNVDSGASIYDAALLLLDQAIANFQLDVVVEPANDFYYNRSWSSWVNAANTLKMKIYLQRRLVDANAIASFNAIVASGDYITDTSGDLEFRWGTNAIQPDNRHPRYAINYAASGASDYMSNWLMNLMDTSDDPRMRYYFYRQVNATPGAEIPPNEETLACSLEPRPPHYTADDVFCYLPNGYWGRDHGQNAGIPPDGFTRTLYGVYPAGGKFDDSIFQGLQLGFGGGGAGITPILLASWVDFMRAEVSMLAGDTATAGDFITAGVAKSVAKVQSFGSLDGSANLSFAPTELSITEHSNDISTAFDNGDDEEKWNILARQFFVASFGNSIDGYNFYRRTGYPTNLQPNIEPEPGAFIRSLNYPADFVNNNSAVSQKPDQTVQVFWDNNGADFPPAN